MTLFSKTNLGAIGLALSWTTLSFASAIAPAPLSAAPAAPFYTAQLATTAADERPVAGGVAWKCAGTTCVASKGSSRPLRVCRELQREVGEIAAFTARGETLDPEALARCNG